MSASTQNQALAALLFLYRRVLGSDVGNLEGVIRARRRQHLPVVLTVEEVRAVLRHLDGGEALVAQLLYGGGLRLMEALRLRIKDVDLEQRCITVRSGKGDKDRRTVLPSSLVDPLKRHMKEVQRPSRQRDRPGAGGLHGRNSRGGTIWIRALCSAPYVQPCRQRGSATSDMPHLPPFIRHAVAGAGHRHPHDSGAARPQRCENHHGLYPCAEQRAIWGTKPRRPALRKGGIFCGPRNNP